MIAADFLGDPTGTGLDMPSRGARAKLRRANASDPLSEGRVALRSVVMVRKLVTIVGSGMGLGIVERAASRSTARGMRLGWSGMTSP
jgi:hypothetical protein